MNDAFSRGLGEIADDAARTSTDLHVDLIVTRRRRRRAARRAAATGGALAVLGVAVLTGSTLLDHRATPALPAGPTSEATEPAPSAPAEPAEPEPGSTPDASGIPGTPGGDDGAAGTAPARPLMDPLQDRLMLVMYEGYDPDEATGEDQLADGDYAGYVSAIDPDALTLDIDVVRVFTPEENRARLVEEGHTAQEVEDWYRMLWWENTSERERTLPLSPDVVVTGYCRNSGMMEHVDLREMSGPRTTTSCPLDEGFWVSDITREDLAQNMFWVDIRDGVVVQLVGQFQS